MLDTLAVGPEAKEKQSEANSGGAMARRRTRFPDLPAIWTCLSCGWKHEKKLYRCCNCGRKKGEPLALVSYIVKPIERLRDDQGRILTDIDTARTRT